MRSSYQSRLAKIESKTNVGKPTVTAVIIAADVVWDVGRSRPFTGGDVDGDGVIAIATLNMDIGPLINGVPEEDDD